MNRIRIIHPIRRSVAALAALAGVLLAFMTASPAAFARPVPTPGVPTAPVKAPPQVHHVIVSGGMPGWQIALIAACAALAAAVIAVTLDRARAARRRMVHAAT